MKPDTDLAGRPYDARELAIMKVYADLKALAAREDNPPCVAANTKAALAAVWQMVNDLGLTYETLDDLGV